MADNNNKKSSWTPQVTEPRSTEMAKLTNPRKVREKQYPADITGLIQKGIDYLTGNTTYEEAPAQLRQDNRSKFGRELDSQLHDNSTLLGNLYRTWLPVVGAAAAVENPLAVANGMLGGAVGAEVIDKLSEKVTGKNWQQLLTPLLGSEAAALTNPGGWAGGVYAEAAPRAYARPKQLREKQIQALESMYPKPPSKEAFQKTRLNAEHMRSDGRPMFIREGVFNTYYVENPIPGETHRSKGGVIAVLPEGNNNMEVHFNPNIIKSYKSVIGSEAIPTILGKDFLSLNRILPDGIPFSQNQQAKPFLQVIKEAPERVKERYIRTGENPIKGASVVAGYSTDINPTMQNYASKGLGYIDRSATTKVADTNRFGESFKKDNLQRYFKKPDEKGHLSFKDMTPEQVARWNKEQADKYNLHIDPETRTAEQYVFVKGPKPNIPLDPVSNRPIFDFSGLLQGLSGGYMSNQLNKK